MKKLILFTFILFTQLTLIGQNPCEMYFETKNVNDEFIEVDLKANDFEKIAGFQIFINWDSTVLEYDKIVYTHNSLSDALFNNGSAFLDNNILASGWYSSNATSISIDDTNALFTIRFKIIGEPCDTTNLQVYNVNSWRNSLIYYENDINEYYINYTHKQIVIPGDNCNSSDTLCTNGFKLTIDEVVVENGSNFCVSIRADSFINIQALQFSIGWNPDVISWVSETNNWARTQGASALHSTPGDSLYYYLMSHYNPLTLGDDSVLVELCFKATGEIDDFSVLNFVDSLVFEIIDASNTIPFCLNDGSVIISGVYNPVTFIASKETSEKDKIKCIDITAENFTDIESFQYIIEWDSSILKFNSLGTINNIDIIYNSNGVGGHIKNNSDNSLYFSWNDVNSRSISNNEILYQLCYDVMGECDDSTSIDIIGNDFIPIEITGNNEILPYSTISGNILITCASEINDFDNFNNNQIEIYPNPTSDAFQISIEGEQTGIYHLEFYGQLGNKLGQHRFSKKSKREIFKFDLHKYKQLPWIVVKLINQQNKTNTFKVIIE